MVIDATVVYTIGHSTRPLQKFVELLQAHGVATLVDVRSFPGSRRYPHFSAEALAANLPAEGIAYVAAKDLGGRRRPTPDSPNMGWRNEGFRGYADYMGTPAFAEALDRLVEIARVAPTAIMCAEAVPWRCHRNLIADALVVLRGVAVKHIVGPEPARSHRPTPFAVKRGGVLAYPAGAGGAEQQELL